MPRSKKPAISKKTRSKPKKLSGSKISLKSTPVVAVLGHVDHGKTSLLDSIRKTNVQSQESGGITQHIGAYQITHQDQPITLIDTPGHAAFAKMRQHGASVTDLVILVIAATEGVKPQTKESIRHIKAAGVPLIVAINKVDMPGASPDMVKSQLVESDVSVEGYGGDTVCVETVATKGKGIPELLDMILLVASMHPTSSDPHGPLKAIVIEVERHKRRGPIVSVIIKNGSLKVRDQIASGDLTTKVKALFDHSGQSVSSAELGHPVQILGFKQLPEVGQIITRAGETQPTETKPKPLSPQAEKPASKAPDTKAQPEEEDVEEEEEKRPRIKAIIKADTKGTLEAIKVNVADEVEKVGEGVGEVNESDILLAQATDAKILAFRVPINSSAKKLSQLENIEIKRYDAIHELLEDLEKQVLKILEPTIDEEVIGEATISAQFEIKKVRIAGCKVNQGKLETNGSVHLMRKDKIIGDATITSLKQGPKDIATAKKGEECGLVLKPSLDFKVGDKVQYYRVITEEKS